MKNGYDIIIVGAGPAGCSSAYFTKYFDTDNEMNVLLLEKFPENKYSNYHHMCGECISYDAFDEIKPIKPKHVVENIKLIREHIVDEFILENKVDGYIIDRPKFFSYIIDEYGKLGGEFRQEKASEIIQETDHIKLKIGKNKFVKTKYLIAADGANSSIRKTMGFEDIRTITCMQYIIDKEYEHDVLDFFYDKKYTGGYKWIFPNGNTTKVGFPQIKNKKIGIDEKILEKQARLIGFGGIKNRVKSNILLIGDAAGQTNAMSLGGIRPGMYAGRLAAEAIVKNNNPQIYEDKWKKSKFNSELINRTYDELNIMNNKEIIEHLEALKGNDISSFFKIMFLRKYRKYWNIYKAYALEKKIGW